jgi:outer membrane protein
MKSINKALISAAAIAALLGTVPAFADDEVYSNSLRAGSYSVFYHTHADDITGPFVPAGVNLKSQDLETLYVGYVRRLSPAFALELALGYPPLNKVEGKGPATVGSVPYNGQVVSTARWLSPAALLEYNFLSEDSKFRPYIGVGVNYTNFYDRKSTAQGNAGLGGPTKLSLTASVGPAATAGVAYAITPRWHVYSSYSIARVNTHVTADTEGVIRTTTIKFGPQTLVISGGYSFGR